MPPIESCKFPEDAEYARKDYVDVLFKGNQVAIDIANKDLDRRLEAMNEFRAQLTEQAKDFLTKEQYEPKHEALTLRIEGLEQEQLVHRRRAADLGLIWKSAISIIGMIATIGTIIALIDALRH